MLLPEVTVERLGLPKPVGGQALHHIKNTVRCQFVPFALESSIISVLDATSMKVCEDLPLRTLLTSKTRK